MKAAEIEKGSAPEGDGIWNGSDGLCRLGQSCPAPVSGNMLLPFLVPILCRKAVTFHLKGVKFKLNICERELVGDGIPSLPPVSGDYFRRKSFKLFHILYIIWITASSNFNKLIFVKAP